MCLINLIGYNRKTRKKKKNLHLNSISQIFIIMIVCVRVCVCVCVCVRERERERERECNGKILNKYILLKQLSIIANIQTYNLYIKK